MSHDTILLLGSTGKSSHSHNSIEPEGRQARPPPAGGDTYAPGASGLAFIRETLALPSSARPNLTLLVRNPSKLPADLVQPETQDAVRVVQGNLTDEAALDAAMQGVTAVVAFLVSSTSLDYLISAKIPGARSLTCTGPTHVAVSFHHPDCPYTDRRLVRGSQAGDEGSRCETDTGAIDPVSFASRREGAYTWPPARQLSTLLPLICVNAFDMRLGSPR